MPYRNADLIKAAGGLPAPQYFNNKTGRYEVLTGRDGANSFIEKGRIVKDYIRSDKSEQRSYPTGMSGFAIVNDGNSDLTFTINGMEILVEPFESFDDLFDPFTEVIITATDRFRAVVRE